MAARIKIYDDWLNKKLVKGLRNEGTFTLPNFFQGDIVPFRVYIVEPDPDAGPSVFNKVDIDNMALKLAVSDTPTGTPAGPTPFVTQFSWTKNTTEKYFEADVAFNTAELDTFLGALPQKAAWLELEVTEASSITTIYQAEITIRAQIIETGTQSVLAGETSLSMEVAKQLFVSKIMDPGETITIPSPSNTRRRIIGCNDDGSGQDDIL